VPYISIMYSTGPLFLSVMWLEYIQSRAYTDAASIESSSSLSSHPPAATSLSSAHNSSLSDELLRFRVLIPDEPNFGNTYGFFNNTDGGSWHGRDVQVIFWMGQHWLAVTVFGFVIGFGVTGLLWWVFAVLGRSMREVRERRVRIGGREGYKLLERIA
jgi:mannosyltransferase OCH1-like enzyme